MMNWIKPNWWIELSFAYKSSNFCLSFVNESDEGFSAPVIGMNLNIANIQSQIYTYGIYVCQFHGIIYSDSSEIPIYHLIINRHFFWWLKRKSLLLKGFSIDGIRMLLINRYQTFIYSCSFICVGVTLEICNGRIMILQKIHLNFEILLCWFQY